VGEFFRDRLPDSLGYFESEDVHLVGQGQWKTGPCHFHGGSDSMRVNIASGGWCCMNCMVKGGDVLAYHMQRHDLDFIAAARQLGAYADDAKPHRGQTTATTLQARDAMQLMAHSVLVTVVVISDIRNGVIPSDEDWQSFLERAGQIEQLAAEYRT
jgi:hypothetical protein